MKKNSLILICCCVLAMACQQRPDAQLADLVILNGEVATLDSTQPTAQAIAIKDGRILHVGSNADMQAYIGDSTEQLHAAGQFVMPGFIEGHGHYSGLGYSLINLNLMQAANWDEIVQLVAEKAKTAQPGEWIVGRGWHQEKWNKPLDKQVQGYPFHDELSKVSPNNPVLLRHASGHSLFANQKAMELAGISAETPNPAGGLIVRAPNGAAVGVFEERAMNTITTAYDDYRKELDEATLTAEWHKAVGMAAAECLRKGITSFQDAGSSYEEISRYRALAESGKLDLRLWAMLRHSFAEMKDQMQGFPIIDAGDGFFTCRAIKTEIDGALGAYGAWLLEPYSDKPNFYGQNTTAIEEVENIARLCVQTGMQLCVHAIGDRGNREVLDVCERTFKANPRQQDLRWRMEHAQHVSVADIPRFAQLGIIASMQGVHCTSDAPFVPKRLGERRSVEEAYPWRKLIDAGAIVTNGTDAPVEDVNPIASFYASVTRKSPKGGEAFVPQQAMTRLEALRSYTALNAYAAFEEKEKGTLAKGKLADITILSHNLLTTPDEDLLRTTVRYTIVGGKVKYRAE